MDVTKLSGFELLSSPDKDELLKFEEYLRRRVDMPTEDAGLAYADVYGEVVFQDPDYADGVKR